MAMQSQNFWNDFRMLVRKKNEIIMNKLLLLFPLLGLLLSCVSVQEVPNVVSLSQSHTRVAILPIKATVERKIWMSNEKYLELCQKKSEEIQLRLYKQFAFYNRDGRMQAEVMSPDEVNAMLFGIDFPNKTFNNSELCSLLHVDAIIWGNIDIREPVSEAAAIALSNNSWFIPITNMVEINLYLYDKTTNSQIWSVNSSRSGQLGSIKRKMQMDVCRRSVRNSPYNLKKRKYKKAFTNIQNSV